MKRIFTSLFATCLLSQVAFSQITDTLIGASGIWKYLDNGTSLDTIPWKTAGYNDSSWKSGASELGYGDGDEATVVGYGPNSSIRYTTTYFRKTFTSSAGSAYNSLTLKVIRDDGIVVYINGNEAYRNNMPTGTIKSSAFASASINAPNESTWYQVNLNPSILLTGTNIITTEIHQRTANSTDISFNATLYASTLPWVPLITRGPYLQKLTPNSIQIRWRTDVSVNSNVRYGTSLNYTNTVSNSTNTTEHQLQITGLLPATKYYYKIGTTTADVLGDSTCYFITAPIAGTNTPVRIWATGDFGNGSSAQTAVKNAYNNYSGNTPTNLWLWLGDNAYGSGTDAQFQSYVFNKYPYELRRIPLFPSPGNHDYASAGYLSTKSLGTNFPYFNIFSVPQSGEAGGVASNTPKYYSYDYANIHFISLDSYGALNNTTSPMYLWLQSDLAANTQRWTIVYFHHPPYTKGSHNSDTEVELIDMRTNIVPLLENYHVDLVLNGHSHVNERSYLIKGHFGLSNTFTSAMKMSTATNAFTKSSPFDGTIYAVCGTSGQSPGSVSSGFPMPCMYFNDNTKNCSVVIDVNGNSLACKFLTSTGIIVDQFTINKVGIRAELKSPSELNLQINYQIGETTAGITYYLEETSLVKVNMFDLTGRPVQQFDEIPDIQSAGYYSYDLHFNSSLKDGIYIIRTDINGMSFSKKIFLSNKN